MTQIKICGLFRDEDVDYVNEAKPDMCGFIIDVPKSHRNVGAGQLLRLRKRLDAGIRPVGVFVNAPIGRIREIVQEGLIDMVQLHGAEGEAYIMELKKQIPIPVIKAFNIRSAKDTEKAAASLADLVLADNGGGTGKTFDWGLVRTLDRPFILSGGLNPDNVSEAVESLHPWAVDMSSGVETERIKDRQKILAAVAAVRG